MAVIGKQLRRIFGLVVLGACLATACGSSHTGGGALGIGATSGGGGGDAASSSTTSTTSIFDFSGNTSSTLPDLAGRLGCTDFNADAQLDRYTDSEATCRFLDKTLLLYGFASRDAEQSWLSLGPQTADNSGTVIVGPMWAIAPFDPSQTDAVREVVGGSVEQMRSQ